MVLTVFLFNLEISRVFKCKVLAWLWSLALVVHQRETTNSYCVERRAVRCWLMLGWRTDYRARMEVDLSSLLCPQVRRVSPRNHCLSLQSLSQRPQTDASPLRAPLLAPTRRPRTTGAGSGARPSKAARSPAKPLVPVCHGGRADGPLRRHPGPGDIEFAWPLRDLSVPGRRARSVCDSFPTPAGPGLPRPATPRRTGETP